MDVLQKFGTVATRAPEAPQQTYFSAGVLMMSDQHTCTTLLLGNVYQTDLVVIGGDWIVS